MTESTQALKERLHILRGTARLVLEQADAVGGEIFMQPQSRHQLAYARKEIAYCKAALRTQGLVVDDLPEDNALADSVLTTSRIDQTWREQIITTLEQRYQKNLTQNFAYQLRLPIGLHTRPDLVAPPSREHLRSIILSQSFPPNTPLIDIFDAERGQVLVIGAAGSGKSTLLVELALGLLARAKANPVHPLPMVLHLTSWLPGILLEDWVIPRLNELVGASKAFAKELVDSKQLLLLLDGLDEVAPESRTDCVKAIKAYLDTFQLAPPFVVACRSDVLSTITTKLPLEQSVELELLGLPAVKQALNSVLDTADAEATFHSDSFLPALLTTPLMVNVLLLAHSGQAVPLTQAGSLEERSAILWGTYLRRLLQHRKFPEAWDVVQGLQWLRWLARLMREEHREWFLLDELQPTALTSSQSRQWYRWMVGITFGLIATIPFSIAASSISDLGTGLLVGCVVGLTFGLIAAHLSSRRPIKREEQLSWSWKRVWQSPRVALWCLGTGALIGPLIALITRSLFSENGPIDSALSIGLVYGLVTGLCVWLDSGWYVEAVKVQSAPLQGVHASFKTALLRAGVGLLVGLGIGMIVGALMGALLIGFVGAKVFGLAGALSGGLVGAVAVGPLGAMAGIMTNVMGYGLGHALGGSLGDVIRHYALRKALNHTQLFPFNAVAFLDVMTEHLILQRELALYRFHHMLLRDFIADLTDEELMEMSRGLSSTHLSN